MQKLGFKNINNDLFVQHSWYFRNALVRANYSDVSQNIEKNEVFLVRFLENLVFGENHILKNREMHIHFKANEGIKLENEGVKVKNEGINIIFEGINEGIKNDLLKIYSFIQKNELAKHTDIKRLIGKSDATIERYLKTLKDKDLIEYVGSKKTGGYRVKN